MTQSERLALAMLRGGRSYDEAAKAAVLPVERVIALWKESKP